MLNSFTCIFEPIIMMHGLIEFLCIHGASVPTYSADSMFEPMKATIELLKSYGEELSDEVHQQLQVYIEHETIWSINICR